MDEAAARTVVLVQAFDAAESPLWTREDAAWATQLTAQTLPADAPPERLLAARAAHALQRLQPRDRDVQRWLARPLWRWRWVALAALLGLIGGLGVDLLGRNQIVDVLAPSVWALVAWNVAAYVLLGSAPLAGAGRAGRETKSGLRLALLRWWQRSTGSGPLRVASRRWAELAVPVTLTRIAALLHVAAAALAIGLLGSMYLRGLVLDYRAGWQSTFLDAADVHRVLSPLLTPASIVTGIAVPDAAAIESMRLTAPAQPASAPAAPWIHLYAATLAMAVVLPRLVLALVAFVQASFRAQRFKIPLNDAATQREVQGLRRQRSTVQLCPYAQSPSAPAALGLRALLAREFGADVLLQVAAATAVGDEEVAAKALALEGVTSRIVLVDLAATPEDDHHGRFVHALQAAAPQLPLLLLVDESAYRRRFAAMPERLDERRAAWRRWAASHGVQVRTVALEGFDAALAGAAAKPATSAR
jgi:hypothetical protein